MATYKSKRNYENAQRMVFDADNKWGIPEIHGLQSYEDCEFIPFNYATSEKHPENKGVHFYLDDYQFIRLWNNPDKYINLLRKFKYVLSPDFSQFTDFPRLLNMYNHYRKHWLGAYLQEHGVNIIPTICWSDMESFDYCFLGEPEGAVVSVSSTGVLQSGKTKDAFIRGYNEMIRQLQPSVVLFFGKPVEGATEMNVGLIHGNAKIIYPEDLNAKRLQAVRLNYNKKRQEELV